MGIRIMLTRRLSPDRALRLIIAALALIIGYRGTVISAARMIVVTDAERAHRVAPGVGQVTATVSEIASLDPAPAEQRRAFELARLALRQDQTSVQAIATLGSVADTRGDTASARRLFGYASALTRRDLRTQIWMIQDAVNRGKVEQALHQYDMTLRVSPPLSGTLFPILVAASSDPVIRNRLIPLLARKPLWADEFITYATSNSPDARSLYELMMGLHRTGVAVPPLARAKAINALLSSGRADAAWNYYAVAMSGADRNRSHNPRFTAKVSIPSTLDWVTRDENGAAAEINDHEFNFDVPSSVGGVLLQQDELLAPGMYHLIGHGSGIDQPESSRPYWVLTCKDGRELGRVVIANSSEAGGRFSGTMGVPENCPVQTLAFVARPSDAVSGVAGQIDYVQLAR